MTVKMCAYPGCDQPCKPTTHRAFSLCESHSREYQRRYKSGNWDGWEKVERANKRKSDRPRSPKRTQAARVELPAPESAHMVLPETNLTMMETLAERAGLISGAPLLPTGGQS